ncbi:MAG TPA: stage II sporulation protein M, partial [Thioalkalivibrio sp.]|nr:stage II sporulation protein M [Thioalkalivibrio sp.]
LYSQPLIERLDDLVLRGHQQLYQSRSGLGGRMLQFAAADFPATVRREWRALALACLLFYGPFLGMLVTVQFAPEFVYTVLDAGTVMQMQTMYDPELNERLGREREADSDVLMFGYYIRNNTSIGFQTFAGGLLFGIGTLFFLIYNGLVIGAVAGHLTHVGYIETFWGFVAGHSAMELTAIVLSGAAGLKLAAGLIRPGRKSRLRALLDNGRIAVTIVFGAAAMFFIAAFIEAFWSSIAWVPAQVKWGVGLFLWVLVIAYFVLLGRGRAA